jgi:DNA-binding NarL/FixJ family response regulator
MDGYAWKVGLRQEVVTGDVDQVSEGWEDVLREILRHVDDDTAAESSPAEENSQKEVILDVFVNGARYTLTRSYTRPSQIPVSLSPREQEIARLIAKGLPNKAISEVLDISPWTVATHLRRIFTKLDVGCRAEMVACLMTEGLLDNSL